MKKIVKLYWYINGLHLPNRHQIYISSYEMQQVLSDSI